MSSVPDGTHSSLSRLALHVLTDSEWSRGRDVLTVASSALDGGATVIQLRNKSASTRKLIEEGRVLRTLTRQRSALLMVNDRVDVALAVDADGAHVGQDDMPTELARQLLGPERLLGVSVANEEEATAAIVAGADYLGVGPIYLTHTKVDAGLPTGLQLLHDLAQHSTIPLIAIGGITAENARDVIQSGATGVAVITAIVNAEDIAAATRNVIAALLRANLQS